MNMITLNNRRIFAKSIWTVFVFCSVLAFGCNTFLPLLKKDSKPTDSNLLQNGSFEKKDGWSISAPPNYQNYATLSMDTRVRKSGRQSAHILIERHPRNDGIEVLHAWEQHVGAWPAQTSIVFGGWVRKEFGKIKMGLRCEFEKPVNGRNFINIQLEGPVADGKFHHLKKTVRLPSIPTRITFYAGMQTLGEAWFDNLYVRRQ